MDARQRALFHAGLRRWYESNRRALPWRETADPYAIWVSEVMLQQTRVATAAPYFCRFMAAFPTVSALAEGDIDDVLKQWEGLGYYARARNLRDAAREVVTRFSGRIPKDIDAFRSLKGVGAYIAAAVQSIAFGKAVPVVDGNVKRVLSRLLRLAHPVNHSSAAAAFAPAAEALLDPTEPGTYNQALMELGALVCTPSGPKCDTCPVQAVCAANLQQCVDAFPKRIERRRAPTHRVVVGVIWRGDRLLVTKRKPDGLLGGLWEFPGGKLDADERAEAACVREIREEVGLEVEPSARIARVRHAYTHFRIVMDVFECRYVAGRVRLNGPVDYKWARLTDLATLPFPRANTKFIPLLAPPGIPEGSPADATAVAPRSRTMT